MDSFFPLSMTSLGMDCWWDYHTKHVLLPVEPAFKSSQSTAGYPITVALLLKSWCSFPATLVLDFVQYTDGWDHWYPVLSAYTASSGTLKASQDGRSLQLSYILLSQYWGVSKSRDKTTIWYNHFVSAFIL